jgi:hypothetical protein
MAPEQPGVRMHQPEDARAAFQDAWNAHDMAGDEGATA